MPSWKPALMTLALLTAATAAPAAGDAPPYPPVTDTAHASQPAAEIFRGFFSAKSRHQPDALMDYFARDKVLYIDASSAGIWPSWAALNKIFTTFMPKWPPSGLSYPTRIYGDEHSALVAFTDTPELFGKELRILGSVSFGPDGKIVRWIDYWDGRSSLRKNSITPAYPTDFHDNVGNATGRIRDVAAQLSGAFAGGDAKAAAAMFSNDAVFEDMALHTQILGRPAIARYLTRALPSLPYGTGSVLAHVVGSDEGGGYEWLASQPASAPLKRGNTALELDATGKISRFTVIYDSNQFPLTTYQLLVGLAAEQ